MRALSTGGVNKDSEFSHLPLVPPVIAFEWLPEEGGPVCTEL